MLKYNYIGKDTLNRHYLRSNDDYNAGILASPQDILDYIKALEMELIVAQSYLLEMIPDADVPALS